MTSGDSGRPPLKVDVPLECIPLADVGARAARLEKEGYDGLWSIETSHDPFLSLGVAALDTENVQLGTAIAVAFARNPMNLAMVANDVQLAAEGRFILGLGSQIRAHIEHRFSMPWSHPAKRMREFILATRAIWSSWNNDTPLNFAGEFYRHTLMTPFFNPGPNPFGPPQVVLAAVGPAMTEVAGEVADGILVHGFTTERYLDEVTLPAFRRGLDKAARPIGEVEICLPCFVATGNTEEAMDVSVAALRRTIAFYGSTPAYRGVLDLHGWGDLQTELNAVSKSDRLDKWSEMGRLIDDDVLHAVAVVAEPGDLAAKVKDRCGDFATRVQMVAPGEASQIDWLDIVNELRAP